MDKEGKYTGEFQKIGSAPIDKDKLRKIKEKMGDNQNGGIG